MRIFITGVSSGLGRELVRILIERGHEVWGIARRTAELDALSGELGSAAFTYDTCDITDITSMANLHRKMTEQNFVPDVVILNAAVDMEDADLGLDFPQGCQMLRTNVDGAYYWISAFIDAFVVRRSGQFIAISSLFAHWPDPASVAYSTSKAALSMLMRGLRLRYAESNLQFKLVYLGPVDTPINPRFSRDEPADSLIVASAAATATYIAKLMDSERENFYFPLYIFIVFAFLRWLPDTWFENLTARFKR